MGSESSEQRFRFTTMVNGFTVNPVDPSCRYASQGRTARRLHWSLETSAYNFGLPCDSATVSVPPSVCRCQLRMSDVVGAAGYGSLACCRWW